MVPCTATSLNGYFGSVYVSCGGAVGLTCTLDTPNLTIAAGGVSPVTARLTTVQPYPTGGTTSTARIMARVVSVSNRIRTVDVTVKIPGIVVACTPTDLTFSYYAQTATDCTVTGQEGFAGTVTLVCQPAQDQLPCFVSPSTITLPENGTGGFQVTLGITPETYSGVYNFHIYGRAGNVSSMVKTLWLHVP
jgi:hypothetical protein